MISIISTLEALVQGTRTLFAPTVITVVLVGTIISLIFGIIPGLSGLVSMSLALPFVYRLSPEVALPFLVSLVSVGFTSGGISSILINVPGTGPSAATLLDGFPMNQKGEGSRAIGAAVMSSIVGGVFGVPVSILMIPVIIPIVLAFKSPEMCVLVVLGLSFMAALTAGAAVKGLISGGLGLLLSTVGCMEITAVARFTFGSLFLYGGIGIVALALGLFGVAEMLDMIMKGQVTIAQELPKGKLSEVFRGVKDVWLHKWLCLRCCVVGHIIGLIPGLGGETSVWIAYGHAKQISKNRDKFGTGCVEGVIAPESADNAKEAGALLTTLAFGIPGSSAMAILLGAFLMAGIIPGPKMLIEHLPLAFTMLLGIVVANVVGGVICLFTAPYLVKLAYLHIDFLFPLILVVILVGAFVAVGNVLNVAVVIILGIAGVIMKRCGYPRPPMLLGLILGRLFEKYFFHSVMINGWLFFLTPICLTMMAIIALLFGYPYLKKVFTR